MNELKHLALILDGNRTWAKEKGLPSLVGHTEGAKNIKRIVKAAIAADIPYVTLYVLSTENLKNRSEKELAHLFSLFAKIIEYLSLFFDNNVRLNTIGDVSYLPENVQNSLKETKDKTKANTGLVLTLAVNYGGRDEITRGIKQMLTDNIAAETLTEDVVRSYLDSGDMPPVDLIIRTSGHQRTSNYLIWQAAYAELYFTDVRWPAFSPDDLQKAIDWYQSQERKGGR